ncbi:MAG TPA: ABC transporter substrate-binding protein [Methanothrix sp.]|jgi:iron complex transport system substrate-binding protein|nr:ABC transporter substrate-binding protein [Methanothrix sp.]
MNRFAFGFVVLACTMLVIMPAVASDYTLGIFGNANMDDTIDELDIEYVRGIIAGTDEATELADANYDGRIDEDDIAQIELIIAGEEAELTIIDSSGRTITVTYPIESIVSLSHTSAEAIKILGAEDRVVGVEQNVVDKAVFFPDLSKLPIVKSGSEADYEKILEIGPELVIAYEFSAAEYAEKLEPRVAVVGFGFYKPKMMSQEIATLGYLLGRTEEAYEFIDFYDGYLDIIQERVSELPEEDKVRAYLEGNSELKAAGNGSGGNDLCKLAGGLNIAVGLLGTYPIIDPEWVITEDPDIMVKSVNHGNKYAGYEKDTTEDIEELRSSFMSRAGWEMTTAVQNGQVFLWSDSISTKPSFFVGVTYLAKLFYPELFEDLDPQAIHQEYLTRFQGLAYDLDEHGVFVYPEVR